MTNITFYTPHWYLGFYMEDGIIFITTFTIIIIIIIIIAVVTSIINIIIINEV
jgi:hypothetical protein